MLMKVKNYFPFRLGTTSYILHTKEDNLIQNVLYLKDFFDNVQLLFFGKDYIDDIASPDVLQKLKEIQEESGIIYTVHLPIDLYLLSAAENELYKSIELIVSIFTKTENLKTDYFILHIDKGKNPDIDQKGTFYADRKRLYEVINLLTKELGKDSYKIAVENISDDLTGFKDILIDSPVNICMDLGHLFLTNRDPVKFQSIFNKKIRVLHLHGLDSDSDHKALNILTPQKLEIMSGCLKNFTGTVIIEVFNASDLEASVRIINKFEKDKNKEMIK